MRTEGGTMALPSDERCICRQRKIGQIGQRATSPGATEVTLTLRARLAWAHDWLTDLILA